jgi:hypothetical protein
VGRIHEGECNCGRNVRKLRWSFTGGTYSDTAEYRDLNRLYIAVEQGVASVGKEYSAAAEYDISCVGWYTAQQTSTESIGGERYRD